jgi:hypothetical protein
MGESEIMNDALLEAVFQRLERDLLPTEAADLLLAALDGDQALAGQLDAPPEHRYAPAQAAGAAPEPVGAYLRSLTVSGFRGIGGAAATLDVRPGPGLTLVVGRNGSGKSSFAEALEALLTGTLMRWSAPGTPVVFKEGWQNKHIGTGTEISAEFLVEGKGKATVARTWPGSDFTSSTDWLQVAGGKREPTDALGWGTDLRTYRPFLSHAELEAFFGRPSELHDLLASVLGLDELTKAADRLSTARRHREDAMKDVRQRLEVLKGRLAATGDERARDCLAALTGKTWDLEAAMAAAGGATAPDGGQLASLRQLRQLSLPADAEVTSAASAARVAAEGLDAVAGTSAGQARSLAQLLEAALEHHAAHGDGDCPVCGQPGALTMAWGQATREHLARLRSEASAADEATAAARTAAGQAMALMGQPPPVLCDAAADTGAGVDVGPARTAWRTRPARRSMAPARRGSDLLVR